MATTDSIVDQARAAGAQMQFKPYNGQMVDVSQARMDAIDDSRKSYNERTGSNLSAKDYDMMVDPDTAGARWGVPEAAPASATALPSGSMSAGPAAPSPAAPAPAPAATYQPAQLSTPTQWNVTPDQTVEGRVDKILSAETPLVQMARTRAKEAANGRGLLNSSMAVQAGETAAYEAALPIAQADAATEAKAAGYNADQSNQFAVRNVDAVNTAGQFNAGAQNTLTGQQLTTGTQRYLGELDATTRANLAQLDASTRTQLSTIEANYKQLMQSNASASDLYRQVTSNITNISLSKDMDAGAKQTAVNNQIQLLKNGMSINGAISNLNLSDLLNFSVNATPAGADTSGTYTAPDGSIWANRAAYDAAHPQYREGN